MPAIGRVLSLCVVLAVLAACGSDPAPGGSERSSIEECAKQRARLVEVVRQPLQRATDQVMGSCSFRIAMLFTRLDAFSEGWWLMSVWWRRPR